MLDTQFILQNIDQVKKACRQKNIDEKVVDKFLALDTKWKKLLAKTQELRETRNKLNQNLDSKPDEKTITQGKKLKKELGELDEKLQQITRDRRQERLLIPNIPSDDTPDGKEDEDKTIVRKWGDIPKFSYAPKDHLELGKMYDLIDTKAGAKVAGFRGYFLKNEAVLLQQALLQYSLGKLLKKGFKPFIPPIICKKRAFINSGHFPWGENEAYELNYSDGKKRYLAGTSEVAMISYHEADVFKEKDLPLKYAAISPCLRKEAGNYGKDTKGLYRLHEFMKVEQIVFCRADREESDKLFEELSCNAEEILKELGLPYRVCLMPAGDMGEPQYKKYDIEAWMPSRDSYGEVMSCSQMLDFQARRAKIKYKAEDGQKKHVYTLNNTAIASPRILIALLEVHQQKNGMIKIPKVLQSLVGKEKISNTVFGKNPR